jgi:peptidoglycan/LPS O-acetylase OafA/YrhL
MKKLTKLEAIRGFAAVYVVFHHTFSKGLFIFGKDISFFFRFGQEAVILFFFLSGFVIQFAYTKSKDKSFKTFFLKRFLRIYIPLVCVYIANYFVVTFSKTQLPDINVKELVGNIFMLQDISALKPNVICDPFMGNAPLWSLSYEWWFYMIFIVVVTKVKHNTSLIIYVIGTVAALTYLVYPNFINRELMYLIIWWIGTDMAKLHLNQSEVTFKSLKVPIFFPFNKYSYPYCKCGMAQ